MLEMETWPSDFYFNSFIYLWMSLFFPVELCTLPPLSLDAGAPENPRFGPVCWKPVLKPLLHQPM